MTNAKKTALRGVNKQEFGRAFLAADYAGCHALLAEAEPSERVTLLNALVLWREQQFVNMIQPLLSIKPKDRRMLAERDTLLALAYTSTNDSSAARARLDRVLENFPMADPIGEEALFFKALNAWVEHEHLECETICKTLLRSSDKNKQARTHFLLSWVALRRRNVQGQLDELSATLSCLEQAEQPDEYYRAKALHALSVLCREASFQSEAQRVRALFEQVHWTNGIRLQQFQTARNLGWISALQGDELAAFRSFRSATQIAPSDYWRVLSLTDRAYLARATGELSFADDLLDEAHEFAKGLQWNTTDDEERSALFVLAALFAEKDPAVAEYYLAQFRSLTRPVRTSISYVGDPRMRAFAQYSAGIAMLNLGERKEAEVLLRDAWETLHGFKYGWRAALCALSLYKTTGDAQWLLDARREIVPWPKSWIARDIAAAGETNADAVPSAQRRVLDLLLEGKTNQQIAKALGRSPFTVRNHIAQLFKTYNVQNRTQLAGLFRKPK